ncbi:MAG: hypothetical protein KatS3mg076_2409 [Candidatus Binatia bacterium]|nr:MAG: hypothetical protein KatS3mg076_2409 [Candidatus Binatia bacterium]
MTPDVPTVLAGLSHTFLFELAPELRSPHAQQSARLGAILLLMVAQEFDRAAERLTEENRAVEELLREGRRLPLEPSLCEEIEATLRGFASSLRVSDLRRRNRELRGVLLRLHEAVELLEGSEAREVEEKIWEELRRSVERRRLDLEAA